VVIQGNHKLLVVAYLTSGAQNKLRTKHNVTLAMQNNYWNQQPFAVFSWKKNDSRNAHLFAWVSFGVASMSTL